jgi:hypothetical protein
VDALRASIEADGQHEPVVTYKGEILDGLSRQAICKELGLPLRSREYQGDNPFEYSLSKNVSRRHLTPSQLAMLSTLIPGLTHGGKRRSKDQDTKMSLDPKPMSRAEKARMFGVSGSLIRDAEKVNSEGAPDLVLFVRTGKKSISEAIEIIKRNAIAPPSPEPLVLSKSPASTARAEPDDSVPPDDDDPIEPPDPDWAEPDDDGVQVLKTAREGFGASVYKTENEDYAYRILDPDDNEINGRSFAHRVPARREALAPHRSVDRRASCRTSTRDRENAAACRAGRYPFCTPIERSR